MPSIIITMIVSFSLSFAFMYWQRQTKEPTVRQQEPLPIPPVTAGPSAPPKSARVRRANVVVPPAVSTAAVDEAPAMPVTFDIWNRRHKNKIEASLMNISDDSLLVQVHIVNQSTKQSSQLAFDLAPHAEKKFGTDDGLEMNSGDQITLQSPPYRDLTREVP